MANRRDFYFRQKVTEAELDAACAELEAADRALASDLGFVGVAVGMAVTQQASPNLTVLVGGPGVVYDQTGQRVAIASPQTVDCEVDEGDIDTAVITPGNSRILSIFAEFDRVLSDPRVDGNSATVFFVRTEACQFNVAAGVEAVSPTAPALRGDQILIADVTLIFGQSTIVNGDISTTRRQWCFKTTSGTSVAVGTAEEAIQALATALGTDVAGLAAHLADSTDAHDASAISSVAAGNLAATDVQTALNELDTEKAGVGITNTFTQQNNFDSGVDVAGTLELDGGTNEVLYSAARSRTIQIPMASGQPQFAADGSAPSWHYGTTSRPTWTGVSEDDAIHFPLNALLRDGMIIQQIRCIVDPVGAQSIDADQFTMSLRYITPNYGTPATPTETVVATQLDDETGNIQTVTIAAINHTVVRGTRDYYIRIRDQDPPGSILYALEFTVDDPGPRNY